jgi:5-aminopentanamidase
MTGTFTSPKPMLRVAMAQLESRIGDTSENLEKAREIIARAGAANADVVAFPEMYLTNYMGQLESRDLAESLDGPSVRALEQCARDHDLYIVMGMPVLEPGLPGFIHNSAVVVSPTSGVMGAHHKISLPTFHIGDLLITEGNHWSPGTQFPLFRMRGWTVAINICADCWVPEIPRVQAVNGAHVLLTISAGPAIFREGWPLVLRTRAIENATFQCFANVVGIHRGLEFFGGNMAVTPNGNVIAQGPIGAEDLLIADLEYSKLHDARTQHPRLRPGYDRHPNLYADLTRSPLPQHLDAMRALERVNNSEESVRANEKTASHILTD